MQKHVNLVDLVKSVQTNTSIYLLLVLVKVDFDTAENEPEYEYEISTIFVFLIFDPVNLFSGWSRRAVILDPIQNITIWKI